MPKALGGSVKVIALFFTCVFFSMGASACMCASSNTSLDKTYESATGVYWAAVTKVEANSRADGRAELGYELTVLHTYKGSSQAVLKAYGSAPFPTIGDQGFQMESTSCDVQYFVGETLLLVVFESERIQLRSCSRNTMPDSAENRQALAELSSNAP